MEPSQATLVFTVPATIAETSPEWFTLEGIGARFICDHPFHEGDQVLLSIRKAPPCPPSPLTQPEPQLNSSPLETQSPAKQEA